MSPEAALIFCRFFTDGAAISVWGTSAYLCTLVPDGLADLLDRRLRLTQGIAIAIVVAMSIALLPLRAATIGAGWNDGIDRDSLSAVLFETNIGSAWAAQTIAAFALTLAFFVPQRIPKLAASLIAAGFLGMLTMTGHAAMNDGWLAIAHRINDFLHLLSGGVWLGSLVPVIMLFGYLVDPAYGHDARLALMRFSTAGHGAVALVIATGIVNMLLIIHGLPVDWSFPYQVMLSAKIGLVAIMVLMAIANRYVFVPRLSVRAEQAMTGLVFITLAEITLGLVVVGLVACFGTLEPN